MKRKIKIQTPKFDRIDNIKVSFIPKTKAEFDAVRLTYSLKKLRQVGVQIWDKVGTKTLFLYPAEWYNHIPENYPIVDIFSAAKTVPFKKGKTDDDSRFGALSFGFVRDSKNEK